jgi:hypothetical protein
MSDSMMVRSRIGFRDADADERHERQSETQ